MRLIDADALLELYADRLEKLEERYGVYSSECGVLAGAMKLLEIQPTIEPERKKGQWEMKPDPYGFFEEIPVCSECGCTTAMRKTYNFCPNCGADMRGEQDE